MESCLSSQLILKNFDSDETFKNDFKGKMDSLLDVSPSGSDANTKITKTKAGYLGVLEIISSQGKFVVETIENDLDIMIKTLFQLMHRQIKHWRNGRFSRE